MANNIKYSKTKIGVFDSGVGGLSILKVLKSQMPYDDFIYFGDTADGSITVIAKPL